MEASGREGTVSPPQVTRREQTPSGPCTQNGDCLVLGRLEVSMNQQRAAAEGCLATMLHSKRSIRKDERPIPSSSPGAAHMASTGIPSEGHRPSEHRPLPFSCCLRRPCSRSVTAYVSTMHSLPQDMLEKAIAGGGDKWYHQRQGGGRKA